jgi:hypothetical protein
MAVFSRLMTQLWNLDPDPSQDQIGQLLRIGTMAPHSILQFGTGDVLFLSDSGVRSLKAFNINLAAAVSDVGSAIDLILTPILAANPDAAAAARAVVQPIQGRYWLYLNGTIYVLSYFPAGQITAWSTLIPPFLLRSFAVVESRVFCFGQDNNLYLYGGVDQNTYDDCLMRVRTPHMSMNAPTENKRIQSIDVVCEGTWTVSVGMLATDTDAFELCATVTNNTVDLMRIPFAGHGTHFAVHLENSDAGNAALLSAIHFSIQEGATK